MIEIVGATEIVVFSCVLSAEIVLVYPRLRLARFLNPKVGLFVRKSF